MGRIKLARLVLGPVSTNCYLLKNEDTGGIVVVDPADQPEEILSCVQELNGSVAGILLTHGHFDHIGAAQELRDQTGALIYAHEAEQEVLADAFKNLSAMPGREQVQLEADCLVKDAEQVQLAGLSFQVLFTPGHTVGGCSYYLEQEGLLFSGDTLFDHSVGRTDFPGGDTKGLLSSIEEKLFVLPEETLVLPGHGPATKIGAEKRENPFVRSVVR